MQIPIWSGLSDKTKYEIRSLLHTFIASAMVVWGMSGFGIPTSKEALTALGIAMGRAGVKAILIALFPPQP